MYFLELVYVRSPPRHRKKYFCGRQFKDWR